PGWTMLRPGGTRAEHECALEPLCQGLFQTHRFGETPQPRFVQLIGFDILWQRWRECAAWTSCEIQPIEQRLFGRGAGMRVPAIQIESVLQGASFQNAAG